MRSLPRIVVSRPLGQTQALCDALAAVGFDATAVPAIEILPAAQPDKVLATLGSIDDVDIIIFVSANAVRFGVDYLPTLTNAWSGQIAAVGPSTARALSTANLECDIVPLTGYTSEALLEEAPLLDVADKRIVIMRGDGGRALLGDTLRERGATVHYAEVYRRRIPPGSAARLAEKLDAGEVDIITATSVETLLNIEQMAGTERAERLHGLKLVTASDRVLKKAQELGYTRDVLLATAPDDAALVNAIVRALPTTTEPDPEPETQSMATDTDKPDDNVVDETASVEPEPAAPEPVIETVAEPAAVAVAAPAPAAKGGRSLALLAIVMSAGAIGASAFTWWKSQSIELPEFEDPAIALESVATSLKGDLRNEMQSARDELGRTATSLRSDVERKIDGIDLSELDEVADEQNKLSRRLSGQERSISTVTDRLTGIEQDMSALQGVSDSVRNTWVRAEAEYFLQTANSRLQLAGDVRSALSALRAADERIGTLGDPGLIPVRAKLTEEILSIEAVPKPDVEGMALTLLGLGERVASLPLERTDVERNYVGSAPRNVDDKSGWERVQARVVDAMSSVVEITPVNDDGVAIVAPDDAYFIYRNLELNLTIARLALMRQDATNFKGSIDTAHAWLIEHFDETDPGVQSMLARLSELSDANIDPTMPDISASLRMLRALVAASSVSQ